MKNYCKMGAGYAIEKAKELNLSEDIKRLIENAYVDGARAVSVNEGMSLSRYQELAMTTCMESSDNFGYMFLNLVGEVGEFASKVAKAIRKRNVKIADNKYVPDWPNPFAEEKQAEPDDYVALKKELRKEAGDIMWQTAGLCKVMGWPLDEVCQENLDKLAARKKAGTIEGNGDGITKAERGK